MPKIPSLALGKRGNLSKFMNWDRISKMLKKKKKEKKEKKEKVPSVPNSVLAQTK